MHKVYPTQEYLAHGKSKGKEVDTRIIAKGT